MKKSTFWKLGISAALVVGLNACSTTSDDDDEVTILRAPSSSYDIDTTATAKKDSTKTSSKKDTDKSDSTSTSDSDTDSTSTDSSNVKSSLYDAPIVSAIIFKPVSTKDEYEFELVVHGNYPTNDIIDEADKIVYEFRWNDEKPEQWDRVKISNSSSKVKFVTDTTRIFTSKASMCHSYASARIIWYTGKDSTVTEWSAPVGPLYTLTQAPSEGRTEFTFTEGTENPCTETN